MEKSFCAMEVDDFLLLRLAKGQAARLTNPKKDNVERAELPMASQDRAIGQ